MHLHDVAFQHFKPFWHFFVGFEMSKQLKDFVSFPIGKKQTNVKNIRRTLGIELGKWRVRLVLALLKPFIKYICFVIFLSALVQL